MKTGYYYYPVPRFVAPLVFLLLSEFSVAQTTWIKTLPGDLKQIAIDMEPAPDGNYWLLTNILPGSGASQAMMLKMDPAGNMLDSIIVSGATGYDLLVLPDGAIIFSGQAMSMPYLAKFSADGIPEWEQFPGNFNGGFAATVIRDSGDGFYIGGNAGSSGYAFVGHYDAAGNKIWLNSYQNIGKATLNKLLFYDNKLYAAGNLSTGVRYWMELNSGGVTQRMVKTRKLASFNQYGLTSLLPIHAAFTSNHELWMVYAANRTSAAIKFNLAGDITDVLELCTLSGYERYPLGFCLDAADNLVMVGAYGQSPLKYTPYIEKRDPNGRLVWTHALPFDGQLYHVIPTPDGGMLASGIDLRSPYSSNHPIHTIIIKFDSTGNYLPCKLSGYVRLDDNENCQTDPGDKGMPDVHLLLDDTLVLNTDRSGYYAVFAAPGAHQLRLSGDRHGYVACLDTVNYFVGNNDTSLHHDFLLKKASVCSEMKVGLTYTELLPCDTSVIFLNWQNTGNAATSSTSALLELDTYLELVNLDAAYDQVDDTHWRIYLGPAGPGERGVIPLAVKLACNSPEFSTHCVRARMEPPSVCSATQFDTAAAYLSVQQHCAGDSVVFTVKNEGMASLPAPTSYQLFSDAALLETGQLNPAPGESWSFSYPANGSTWVMELSPTSAEAGLRIPGAISEGCGLNSSGARSSGFVNMFSHYNTEPWTSESCMEQLQIKGQAHMYAIPRGYGSGFDILPVDQDFEFVLVADIPPGSTAGKEQVLLYPSLDFDPATFALEASSIAFDVQIQNNVIILTGNREAIAEDSTLQLRFRLRFFGQKDPSDHKAAVSAEVFFPGQRQMTPAQANFTIGNSFFVDAISPYPESPELRLFGRGNADESASDVVQTPDGSLFLAGYSHPYIENSVTAIVKTDSSGRQIWFKTYQFGAGNESGVVAVALPDNDIIIAGTYEVNDPVNDETTTRVYVARLNPDGEVRWTQRWEQFPSDIYVRGALPAPDGGVIFLSTAYGYGGPTNTIQVLRKVTQDGTLAFTRNVTGDYYTGGGIWPMKDGTGFVFLGSVDANYSGYPYHFLQLDWNGQTKFDRTYNFPQDNQANFQGMTTAPEGGFLLAGFENVLDPATHLTKRNLMISKYSDLFELEWKQDNLIPEIYYAGGITASDSAIYISGYTNQGYNGATDDHSLLMKFNASGTLQWIKNYAARANTNSGKCFIGQHRQLWLLCQINTQDIISNDQMCLVKQADNQATSGTHATGVGVYPLSVNPVPARDLIWINHFPAPSGRLVFYDLQGRMLYATRWENLRPVDVGNLPAGLIFFCLTGSDGRTGAGRMEIIR